MTPDPAAFARSINAFGLDLWRHVPAGNQVISPASIAIALGMTLVGARGATADQMARVLHVEGDPAAFHRAASSVSARWYVPGGTLTLAKVEAALTPARLASWVAALESRPTEVALPRFRVAPPGPLTLADTLQAMGMELPFDRRRADFSGMTTSPDPDQRVVIAEVFHKAFVDVDEAGTEAAAATAVSMFLGAAPRPGPPPAVFRADHPFLFLLRDTRTGAVLFLGRVLDPSS